jgi:hypothetical protein
MDAATQGRGVSPPHRLDAGTSGVMVLSRTLAFTHYFQKQQQQQQQQQHGDGGAQCPAGGGAQQVQILREGDGSRSVVGSSMGGVSSRCPDVAAVQVQGVCKWYRCVTSAAAGPPPLGLLRHWALINTHIPGAHA